MFTAAVDPDSYQQKEGGTTRCKGRTIRRKGYTAVRAGKTIRVKSACIKDRGAKGRWQTIMGMVGIGPLRSGDLTSLGYSSTAPAAQRHRAIEMAVRKYGPGSTLRKLNAVATYTKRTSPSRSKTYKSDKNYVQKKYFPKK